MGFVVIVTLMCFPVVVWSHARLMSPPSRSSMWRLGFPTKRNFNDNALYCGGINVQWQKNGGKCGICGDPYNMPHPRDNEAGGKYGQGIISKRYVSGQVIETTVDVTTNHRGYFEFKLCPNNNPRKEATQECMDKHVLREAYGTGTRYYIGHRGNGDITVKLQLPKGLSCSQCVFQWTYVAGNNWGKCEDGKSRLGCGPQETFRGCADIAIDKNSTSIFNVKPEENDVNYLSIHHHKTNNYSKDRAPDTNHMIYTYEVTKQSRQKENSSTSTNNHNHSLTLDSIHYENNHINHPHIHHTSNNQTYHLVPNHSHHHHSNHSHTSNDSHIHGNDLNHLNHSQKGFHHIKSKIWPTFNRTGKPNETRFVLSKRRYNNVANSKRNIKFDYRHFYSLSDGKSKNGFSVNNNKRQSFHSKHENRISRRKANNQKSGYPDRHLPSLTFLDTKDDVSLSQGFSLGGRRYTDFWFL